MRPSVPAASHAAAAKRAANAVSGDERKQKLAKRRRRMHGICADEATRQAVTAEEAEAGFNMLHISEACHSGERADAAGDMSSGRPTARLSQAFSFGGDSGSRSKADEPSSMDTDEPCSVDRPTSKGFGRNLSQTAPAADDGQLVGEEVIIHQLDDSEARESVRGEAILYDFHEAVYTVLENGGQGRRLHVPPTGLEKASPTKRKPAVRTSMDDVCR